MSDDRLALLRSRLDELGHVPVSAHPDVLDEVHQAIVAELGSLAESRAQAPRSTQPS